MYLYVFGLALMQFMLNEITRNHWKNILHKKNQIGSNYNCQTVGIKENLLGPSFGDFSSKCENGKTWTVKITKPQAPEMLFYTNPLDRSG